VNGPARAVGGGREIFNDRNLLKAYFGTLYVFRLFFKSRRQQNGHNEHFWRFLASVLESGGNSYGSCTRTLWSREIRKTKPHNNFPMKTFPPPTRARERSNRDDERPYLYSTIETSQMISFQHDTVLLVLPAVVRSVCPPDDTSGKLKPRIKTTTTIICFQANPMMTIS
jgi:hypothetical protein